jgi:hypothetical protein
VVLYIFELSDTSEKTLEVLKLKSGSESPILKRASEEFMEDQWNATGCKRHVYGGQDKVVVLHIRVAM